MGNFTACYEVTAKLEGGYVNNPADPGGATNRGITQKTYDGYRLRMSLAKRNVRDITDEEVVAIYREQYWEPIKGDLLPLGLDLVTYDFAVNSGVTRAVRHLQAALGVRPDGIVGNQTIGAAIECQNRNEADAVIMRIMKTRYEFLHGLSTWSVFGKGWQARVETVRETALLMDELSHRARSMVAGDRKSLGTTASSTIYNPKVTYEPEAIIKAGLNSFWAALTAGSGGLLGLLPQLLALLKDTRSGMEGLGLPATVISTVLLGTALAFIVQSYNRNRQQAMAESPEAQVKL